MLAAYREHLPLVPGAVEAVQRLAERFPLGLASSSNRPLIDTVLELAGIASFFRATVSSEEVARGKPAPDVYLETARRLGVAPERCAAIEDSHAGIRSAHAAGMRVVAIPNPSYPPDDDALAHADVVLALARRAHAGGRRRIIVTPSRTGSSRHSTRGSSRTRRLNSASGWSARMPESVLSQRIIPSSASRGSTAS